MKTILNTQMKEELIARINHLHEDCVAQWGKMNVYQMVRHCILWEELCQGKTRYKRATLIWRILGKIVFWVMTKDDKPFKTNIQTLDQLKVTEISGDLEGEKNKLIALIHEYKNYPKKGVVQPYFGRINREKQSQLTYKHIDHHLRQFNC